VAPSPASSSLSRIVLVRAISVRRSLRRPSGSACIVSVEFHQVERHQHAVGIMPAGAQAFEIGMAPVVEHHELGVDDE
jgi:hypothetical protein